MTDSVAVDAKRILLRYGAPIAILDKVSEVHRIEFAREIAKTMLPERERRLRQLLAERGYADALTGPMKKAKGKGAANSKPKPETQAKAKATPAAKSKARAAKQKAAQSAKASARARSKARAATPKPAQSAKTSAKTSAVTKRKKKK